MARRALLVGVNDYPGTSNDLHGCLNDVANVADLLVSRFAFASADIRVLKDRQATKATILDSLGALLARSTAGDVLVFHYSGHGSQIRDRNGDELGDGLDEIICPWDFDWNGTFIADDDFADLLRNLPKGVSLEVILDSCHSGTGTRELILDRHSLGGVAPGMVDEEYLQGSRHCIRPRFYPQPPDIARRADELSSGGELKRCRAGQSVALNHVLWSACRSDQYSADAEIDGAPAGAFTYWFCRQIRQASGKLSRSEMLRRVRASLRDDGFSQVPQLECPAARKAASVFI
jgi:hypothetical protein